MTSLSSTVYSRVTEMLHHDIVAGTLPPMERLKVNDLAARYGVSPSPIREALQQLQAEGLIVLAPNRGAFVRRVDPRELGHMMNVRAAVEGMQARLCASMGSDAPLAKIEAAEAAFAAAVEKRVAKARMQSNAEFHRLINACDGSKIAVEILQRVTSVTASIRRDWPHGPERMALAVQEHAAIVAALRAGNADQAEEAARRHVLNSLHDIFERMREAGVEI